MSAATPSHGRRTLEGTAIGLVAEALVLPAGLVTLAVLTRRLGASDYGRFTVAMTLVAWIEWTITAFLGRATNKCVADADDWRPPAAAALRLRLATGVLAALVLAALAPFAAAALGEPSITPLVRILALDIPLFCAAQAHRDVLVGLGRFRARAALAAVHWLGLMAFVAVLVGLGFSLTGAAWGTLATSCAEIAVARRLVRLPLRTASAFPVARLLAYAAPLLLFALCLRTFTRLDLFMLKLLGASAAEAGAYGVAQSLAGPPALLTLTFSPILQTSLVRLLREGDAARARRLGRDALRAVTLCLPLAALVAGAAGPLVRLVSGAGYAEAPAALALLIFGNLAMTLIGVCAGVLVAYERPRWTVAITGPTLALALPALLWAVPRNGTRGAAAAATACAMLGGAAALGAVWLRARIAVPPPTALRAAGLAAAAYGAARHVPEGPAAPALLVLLAVAVAAGVFVTGEFDAAERATLRDLLRRRRQAP